MSGDGLVVLRQTAVTDIPAVGAALQEAFVTMREAVLAEHPMVVVVRDDDLLGQRTPEGAALAMGLLGMVRALALEGASRGWRINAVSHTGDEAAADEAVQALVRGGGLTGQLLRVTTGHLGKISP